MALGCRRPADTADVLLRMTGAGVVTGSQQQQMRYRLESLHYSFDPMTAEGA